MLAQLVYAFSRLSEYADGSTGIRNVQFILLNSLHRRLVIDGNSLSLVTKPELMKLYVAPRRSTFQSYVCRLPQQEFAEKVAS